ncbi:Uncharacterised protein [uncultured archaeon]|nr:Uncharacterised protein [uncultured archaeon]
MSLEETLQDTKPSVEELLSPKNWPDPKFYAEKKGTDKMRNYETSFSHELHTRYVELESDFRTTVGNYPEVDPVSAMRVFEFLQSARNTLERENSDLLMVYSTLEMAERYMVWVYPDDFIKLKIVTTQSYLESLQPAGWEWYRDQLKSFYQSDLSEQDSLQLRGVLDEAIGAYNKKMLQEQISSGLQIERLKALRNWGMALLAVLLVGSPLATNIAALKDWLPQLITTQLPVMAAWINTLEIAIFGAAGGFLSGLLQARSSKVTLPEYQENMLKLQLKPLVGAIVSLILYVFLSWQILPGITIQNTGSYFVIAFLAGFSERYFLRLLELKTDNEGPSETPKAASQAKGENAK